MTTIMEVARPDAFYALFGRAGAPGKHRRLFLGETDVAHGEVMDALREDAVLRSSAEGRRALSHVAHQMVEEDTTEAFACAHELAERFQVLLDARGFSSARYEGALDGLNKFLDGALLSADTPSTIADAFAMVRAIVGVRGSNWVAGELTPMTDERLRAALPAAHFKLLQRRWEHALGPAGAESVSAMLTVAQWREVLAYLADGRAMLADATVVGAFGAVANGRISPLI